jgi:AmmeMemoRadiSam system protein A
MLPLTAANEQILLRLARQALEEAARHRHPSDTDPPPGALREKCGAFVTLHKAGSLRGCIGYAEPTKPLYQTVRECALAAALHDPRFEPVTADELPHLRLEISVLSPLEEIEPARIEVGRHGLMVSLGFQRGLLLPRVAVDWKWDRIRFLEETCAKAGLPRHAWRHEARIQAFTAQVFAEPHDLTNATHHAA